MKKISEKAGCAKLLQQLLLNCYLHRKFATLDSAGFESRDILSVSGHHSEQSLKNYSKTSHEKKRQMAASLGSHFGERGEASGPGPPPAPSKPSTSSSSRKLVLVVERNAPQNMLSVPTSDSPNTIDVRVNSHITMSEEEAHV